MELKNLINFKEFDITKEIKNDKKIAKEIVKESDETFEEKLDEAFELNPEVESKNLFGFAQEKDRTIKKIGSFTSFTKMINPKTPKMRSVLNAGQFIDNDKVQGYVNRIEGNKVFVESLEKPGEIVEISIKDAVKIKKEEKEHTVTKKIEKED